MTRKRNPKKYSLGRFIFDLFMTELANKIVGQLKKALKIRSPSRELIQQPAQFLAHILLKGETNVQQGRQAEE